jgi:hypothetical protein
MKKILVYVFAVAVLSALLFVFAKPLVLNLLGGHVHFPEKYVGQYLTMEDGKKFLVFRRLMIGHENHIDRSPAVFKVRFQFKNLKPSINKQLSMIPAPFLIGMKGFREKYWTFDEHSGFFQGIYQWESEEAAQNYTRSFIYKLMIKRSAKGTLSYEIIPDTDLSQYIEKRSSL